MTKRAYLAQLVRRRQMNTLLILMIELQCIKNQEILSWT